MRKASAHILVAVLLLTVQASAQNQPATIPTIVAQASGFMMGIELGRVQYFDARTPPDWPMALVPLGARIIGGSAQGDPAMFRLVTAVFELPTAGDPRAAIRDLLRKAGFDLNSPTAPKRGGFVPTAPEPTTATRYCKGDSAVVFDMWDAAHTPGVVVMHMIVGRSARESCDIQNRGVPEPMREAPAKFPPLTPPAGVLQLGGGSGWSGSSGEITTQLRTTLAPDSILAHYAPQMAAGGWTAEGKPAVVQGLAIQRFVSRQNGDKWFAALVVMEAGDLRDVRILFSKDESR